MRAFFQCQILFLCGYPIGCENLGQWLTFNNGVEWRTHKKSFDESTGARLHHRDRTFIERDGTDDLHLFVERALRYFGGADTQVLHHARRDLYRSGVTTVIAINRHQHHVHERRFAGLVEFLLRVHRVVVVERLLVRGSSGCIRRHAGARHRALQSEPVTATDADND